MGFGEDVPLQSLSPARALSLQLLGPFALNWGGSSLVLGHGAELTLSLGEVLWFALPQLLSHVWGFLGFFFSELSSGRTRLKTVVNKGKTAAGQDLVFLKYISGFG